MVTIIIIQEMRRIITQTGAQKSSDITDERKHAGTAAEYDRTKQNREKAYFLVKIVSKTTEKLRRMSISVHQFLLAICEKVIGLFLLDAANTWKQ